MDRDMNERAPTDEDGNLILNYGTVLQGQAKSIKLYAHNTITYPIQLEPLIENNEPDLKITKYPPILQAGEVSEVVVTFKPDPDRIEPLQSGWDFRKIILTRT